MTTRTKTTAIFLVALMVLALVPSLGLAAPQPDKSTKMTIKIDIADPQLFWTYPYITKDGKIRKPAAVQVEWSAFFGMSPTRVEVLTPGQGGGRLTIATEKNAIVDIQISVVDAGKVILGTGSLQVRNGGQEEVFLVSLPDITSPQVNHDTAGSQNRKEI